MRLGVIGGGVVGRATARAFLEHVEEVRVHDTLPERSTHSLTDVLGCDLVFVCLPTPQQADSLSCDLTAVEHFFRSQHSSRVSFVLRSTVPIGTTARLAREYDLPNLVHSPEFLTARCAVSDAQLPARNVLGVTPGSDAVRLARLYTERYPGVPLHIMTSNESEAVKLFQNSFFAVKVSFWNECRQFADRLGLSWDVVLEAILADGRISFSHTRIPGPDGRFGFGGSCLPKDLANLITCMAEAGLTAPVSHAAHFRNLEDRIR